MRIDNSAAKTFLECPLKYFERYENNLELTVRDREGLDFGTRFHELQNLRFKTCTQTPLEARLEAEVQATFAGYLQQYPADNWQVVDVERTQEVPLSFSAHTLAVKMDLVFREPNGGLCILDYKTEKRGSPYNTPDSWAARAQVGLYQYAAEIIYGEPIAALWLDVTTRQSPKGQEPPLYARQRLVRTRAQMLSAVKNIVWVADQVEQMRTTGFWPSNTEGCMRGRYRCDYYPLHVIGRTDGNLRQFKQAEPYLDL